MKSWIKWILATIILAAIIHVVIVKSIPYYIMKRLGTKSVHRVNTIIHAPPTSADFRRVVRPSPDLLYSACGYDVSERPLRITAVVPGDTYFSISAFSANTDNFFALNDRQVKSKQMEIILVKKGTDYPGAGSAKVVETPTDRGIVLFRMLIKDRARLDEYIRLQKQASCGPVKK